MMMPTTSQHRLFTSLSMCALSCTVVSLAEATDIEDIVKNVCDNEALFQNIDVTLSYSYSIGGRQPATVNEQSEVTEESVHYHYVAQNGLCRLDLLGERVDIHGAHPREQIHAFDGDKTRIFNTNRVNIYPDKVEIRDAVLPHNLLLRAKTFAVPLSVFLSGHGAMRAHPLGRWKDGNTLAVDYRGEDEVNGLRCHRIDVTAHVLAQRPAFRWTLWLAEDRNYMPVKAVIYALEWSSSIPCFEAEVTNFKELVPSVWFPVAVQQLNYSKPQLKHQAKLKLLWRKTFSIEDVSLQPDYDRSYFQGPSIIDGTLIYEMEGQSIKKSRVQGAPGTHGEVAHSFQAWLLLANVLFIGSIMLFVAGRRRKNRTLTPTPSGL